MLSKSKKLSKVPFFLFLFFSFLALGFTLSNSVSAYTSEDMPQGYRVFDVESDVNKVFGVDLEPIIYFDTSYILSPSAWATLIFNDSNSEDTYEITIFSSIAKQIVYNFSDNSMILRTGDLIWNYDSISFPTGVYFSTLENAPDYVYKSSDFSFIYVKEIERETLIESILSLFNKIVVWLPSTVLGLFALFYDAETGLTFLGALAVAGLAISVIFLLIGIIQNFLHFRG